MDKFDDMLKNSKTTYEPNTNFVEDTMTRITTATQPNRGHGFRFWLAATGGAVVVIALVFIAFPSLRNAATPQPSSSTNTSQTAAGGGNTAPQTTSLPAGTDDASLASDLNSIQSSENQEQTDQSGATSTLNDSSQQIAIPTD